MAQPSTATAQAGAALTAEEARGLIAEHARMIELERRESERQGLVGKAQGESDIIYLRGLGTLRFREVRAARVSTHW